MSNQHVYYSNAPRSTLQETAAPLLIFTTELCGEELLGLLARPGLLDTLASHACGIALGLARRDDAAIAAARVLAERNIPLVAWLTLAPHEGYTFNLHNYPQAVAHYRAFRAWAAEHQLRFDAVGLEMTTSPYTVPIEDLTPREVVHRLRTATEHMLYTAARTAYVELFSVIHQDGYEIHTYELPFVADDRRAGTTLVQRALDIIDLPSDIDVLMCSSGVPFERLNDDLGGALIASYGLSADAIGVSSAGLDAGEHGPRRLPWESLRRDLLLAAQFTDTIYVESLESCVERGVLERVLALDWGAPMRAQRGRLLIVSTLRGALFATLMATRFGLRALAWLGWALAALLLFQRQRARRRGED